MEDINDNSTPDSTGSPQAADDSAAVEPSEPASEESAQAEAPQPQEQTLPAQTETPSLPAQAGEVAPSEATNQSFIKNLLAKAGEKIQFNKKKKLEKIMVLVNQNKKITIGDVKKLLMVSDSSATRYLSELEKQGRLIRKGETKGEFYQPV